MRKHFRTILTTTAVPTALAGRTILPTYADTPSSRGSGGKMGQMNQTMEICNINDEGNGSGSWPGYAEKDPREQGLIPFVERIIEP